MIMTSYKYSKEKRQGLIVRLLPDMTITITALGIIVFFHCVLVGILMLVPGLVFFFVAILAFSISIFRTVGFKGTAGKGFLTMLILFCLSACSFFWDFRLPDFVLDKTLLPTMTVLVGIVEGVILARMKELNYKVLGVRFLLLLGILLAMLGPLLLTSGLPYIYCPPTLTPKNIVFYKKCIKFLTNCPQYKIFVVDRRNWISLGQDYGPVLHEELGSYFSESEADELLQLWRALGTVKCQRFQRENDIVLFYKNGHYILPGGFGVVYSLSGRNPNEIDSEVLNKAKPFLRIARNWYMSRHLILIGPRATTPASIPISLIDHSLCIEGIDLNELNKFD